MARFSLDGEKTYESEKVTPRELASIWHLKKALALSANGTIVDCDQEFTEDTDFSQILGDTEEGQTLLRHSTAHLMAQAILHLYPEAKFGIGPAIKDGFYYDIRFPESISEDDLATIEKEMRKLSEAKIPLTRSVISKAEALKMFADKGENLKTDLIENIEDDTVSIYNQGDFCDLCRGPHVFDTGRIKFFKLLSLAGAYWHGDEHNEMLTRIYGTVFASEAELKDHLRKLEEAKARDHRKLGKELNLFSIHNEGPGFPFFHPKGMVIMNALQQFWRNEHTRRGYVEVKTPMILDRSLWLQSGHWDHYKDNMYFTTIDEQPFAIKPMNCPGGILIYKNEKHSYKELPIRMGELGFVHRHERSGALHGLMRVRAFTQDDAHIFCTKEQIKDEIKAIMDLENYVYTKVFNFKYFVELSTRPEDSMGDPELWELAENCLREALEETNTPYKLNPGDGAFYGPKIDFHLEDCIGRTWQCGTIQLDFQMPEKFDITYIGQDGAEHRPVMLHRTIMGSIERFMGILIENYAGAFPYWLSPVQAKILPVSEAFNDYAFQVVSDLKKAGIRTEIDTRDEKLGKKIRDAQLEKAYYMIVIGAKEAQTKTIAIRHRSEGDKGSMTLDEFVALANSEFNPM